MSLLLSLNSFHVFTWCLHCWQHLPVLFYQQKTSLYLIFDVLKVNYEDNRATSIDIILMSKPKTYLMREYPLQESSFVYTNPAFSFTKSEQRSKNSLMVAVKQWKDKILEEAFHRYFSVYKFWKTSEVYPENYPYVFCRKLLWNFANLTGKE